MKCLFITAICFVVSLLITLCSNDTELIYSQSTPLENLVSYHTCIDTTHMSCDGNCICDGMECH